MYIDNIPPPQTTSCLPPFLAYARKLWRACNIPVYSNINSSSSKIPKQFADVLYSEVKKLFIVNFIRTQRKDSEIFDIDVVLNDQGKQSHTIGEFAPCENLIWTSEFGCCYDVLSYFLIIMWKR